MRLSTAPLSCLEYFSPKKGTLRQAALCRTDNILGVGTVERTIASLFDDYVSGYSPLTAEVGDTYWLPSSKMIGEFVSIGGSIED